MKLRLIEISLSLVFWLFLINTLNADEFRPALLEVSEHEGGWVEVTWKVPMLAERKLAISPVFPAFFEPLGPGTARYVPGALIETRSYSTTGRELTGTAIGVEGLDAVPTDVVLQVNLKDGAEYSAILRSHTASFVIPQQPDALELAVSYWKMGTIHILEGYDHLLFLLALLMIVSGIWPLLKTVTAFTLAHSLTLVLATLGMVRFPQVPTEAVISLSIMLLAVEIVNKNAGQLTLSERFPWVVAFTFGLVHGLGFAGALAEIGVPQNAVPLALLTFNLGVETGQVLFVVVVSLILSQLHRIHQHTALQVARAIPYVIGGVAAYWTIDRVTAFL